MADPRVTAKRRSAIRYRYKVVEIHGDVPEQITESLNDPDSFLLYKEDRGPESQQSFMRNHAEVGGWVMERRGAVLIRGNKVVQEFTDDQIADKDDEAWN